MFTTGFYALFWAFYYTFPVYSSFFAILNYVQQKFANLLWICKFPRASSKTSGAKSKFSSISPRDRPVESAIGGKSKCTTSVSFHVQIFRNFRGSCRRHISGNQTRRRLPLNKRFDETRSHHNVMIQGSGKLPASAVFTGLGQESIACQLAARPPHALCPLAGPVAFLPFGGVLSLRRGFPLCSLRKILSFALRHQPRFFPLYLFNPHLCFFFSNCKSFYQSFGN